MICKVLELGWDWRDLAEYGCIVDDLEPVEKLALANVSVGKHREITIGHRQHQHQHRQDLHLKLEFAEKKGRSELLQNIYVHVLDCWDCLSLAHPTSSLIYSQVHDYLIKCINMHEWYISFSVIARLSKSFQTTGGHTAYGVIWRWESVFWKLFWTCQMSVNVSKCSQPSLAMASWHPLASCRSQPWGWYLSHERAAVPELIQTMPRGGYGFLDTAFSYVFIITCSCSDCMWLPGKFCWDCMSTCCPHVQASLCCMSVWRGMASDVSWSNHWDVKTSKVSKSKHTM